jgi:hypothetical protein
VIIREGSEYWTVHRCTNVPSRQKVYLTNGVPTFRCDCGDTVFTTVDRLEGWQEVGQE